MNVEIRDSHIIIEDKKLHKSVFRDAIRDLVGFNKCKGYNWETYKRFTDRAISCIIGDEKEFGLLAPFEGDENLESFTFYIGDKKLSKEERNELIEDILSNTIKKELEKILKENQLRFEIESCEDEIRIKNCLNKSSAHIKKKRLLENSIRAYKKNSREYTHGKHSYNLDSLKNEEKIYHLDFKNHEKEEFNTLCSICTGKNNILFNMTLNNFSLSNFSICKKCLDDIFSEHILEYKNQIIVGEI